MYATNIFTNVFENFNEMVMWKVIAVFSAMLGAIVSYIISKMTYRSGIDLNDDQPIDLEKRQYKRQVADISIWTSIFFGCSAITTAINICAEEKNDIAAYTKWIALLSGSFGALFGITVSFMIIR